MDADGEPTVAELADEPIRVALVGCGTIAQIMHLPNAVESPAFEVVALCDPAERLRRVLGDRYGVDGRCAEVEALVDERAGELDAAVVSTPVQTHLETVRPLLSADVPVLVEKPLEVTPDRAGELVAAAGGTDAVATVGYMKRHHPSFRAAEVELAEFEAIDLVTCYDVDPDHRRIVEELYDLVEGDLPAETVEAGREKRRRLVAETLGTDDETLTAAYSFQLAHACHDLNALRGLLGDFAGVERAAVHADGRYLTGEVAFEDGTPCVLEFGTSDRKWFEEWIQVDAPDGQLELSFGNPFQQQSPPEVTVRRGVEELTETTRVPSYDDSFRAELHDFARAIRGGDPPGTSFREAAKDVADMRELVLAAADGR